MKILLIILITVLTSLAAVQASEFQGYGISFPIPEGWNVAQNNTTGMANDTKIVLTDGNSAIRLDIVTLPQMPWLRSTSDGHSDFAIFGLVMNYYKKNILNQDIQIVSTSGTQRLHPDGVQNLNFQMTEGGDEWVIAWSNPSYDEKFIGVHAIFIGKYDTNDVGFESSEYEYNMPLPLYEVLNSFKTRAEFAERTFKGSEDVVAKV